MAKFKYRMQNILDIKRKLEEQEKINFGIANARLEEEKDKLRKLMRQQQGYEEELTGLMEGTIDLRRIKETREAIRTMKTLVRTQMIQVHVAEKNLEQARERLKAVQIDRKTHEKLREHAFDEFKQELAYEENKSVDELVSYTYHRTGE